MAVPLVPRSCTPRGASTPSSFPQSKAATLSGLEASGQRGVGRAAEAAAEAVPPGLTSGAPPSAASATQAPLVGSMRVPSAHAGPPEDAEAVAPALEVDVAEG